MSHTIDVLEEYIKELEELLEKTDANCLIHYEKLEAFKKLVNYHRTDMDRDVLMKILEVLDDE